MQTRAGSPRMLGNRVVSFRTIREPEEKEKERDCYGAMSDHNQPIYLQ